MLILLSHLCQLAIMTGFPFHPLLWIVLEFGIRHSVSDLNTVPSKCLTQFIDDALVYFDNVLLDRPRCLFLVQLSILVTSLVPHLFVCMSP